MHAICRIAMLRMGFGNEWHENEADRSRVTQVMFRDLRKSRRN